MSSDPQDRDTSPLSTSNDEPIAYPVNDVLAVLDTRDELAAAILELTAEGVRDSEVQVTCGSEQADALRDSTGRGGLAGLAIRIADQLGIQNPEMETKAKYEQAMRDGRYVLRVPAPTDEHKARVVEVLNRHGAHGVGYFTRFTIERIVPHRQA